MFNNNYNHKNAASTDITKTETKDSLEQSTTGDANNRKMINSDQAHRSNDGVNNLTADFSSTIFHYSSLRANTEQVNRSSFFSNTTGYSSFYWKNIQSWFNKVEDHKTSEFYIKYYKTLSFPDELSKNLYKTYADILIKDLNTLHKSELDILRVSDGVLSKEERESKVIAKREEILDKLAHLELLQAIIIDRNQDSITNTFDLFQSKPDRINQHLSKIIEFFGENGINKEINNRIDELNGLLQANNEQLTSINEFVSSIQQKELYDDTFFANALFYIKLLIDLYKKERYHLNDIRKAKEKIDKHNLNTSFTAKSNEMSLDFGAESDNTESKIKEFNESIDNLIYIQGEIIKSQKDIKELDEKFQGLLSDIAGGYFSNPTSAEIKGKITNLLKSFKPIDSDALKISLVNVQKALILMYGIDQNNPNFIEINNTDIPYVYIAVKLGVDNILKSLLAKLKISPDVRHNVDGKSEHAITEAIKQNSVQALKLIIEYKPQLKFDDLSNKVEDQIKFLVILSEMNTDSAKMIAGYLFENVDGVATAIFSHQQFNYNAFWQKIYSQNSEKAMKFFQYMEETIVRSNYEMLAPIPFWGQIVLMMQSLASLNNRDEVVKRFFDNQDVVSIIQKICEQYDKRGKIKDNLAVLKDAVPIEFDVSKIDVKQPIFNESSYEYVDYGKTVEKQQMNESSYEYVNDIKKPNDDGVSNLHNNQTLNLSKEYGVGHYSIKGNSSSYHDFIIIVEILVFLLLCQMLYFYMYPYIPVYYNSQTLNALNDNVTDGLTINIQKANKVKKVNEALASQKIVSEESDEDNQEADESSEEEMLTISFENITKEKIANKDSDLEEFNILKVPGKEDKMLFFPCAYISYKADQYNEDEFFSQDEEYYPHFVEL